MNDDMMYVNVATTQKRPIGFSPSFGRFWHG